MSLAAIEDGNANNFAAFPALSPAPFLDRRSGVRTLADIASDPEADKLTIASNPDHADEPSDGGPALGVTVPAEFISAALAFWHPRSCATAAALKSTCAAQGTKFRNGITLARPGWRETSSPCASQSIAGIVACSCHCRAGKFQEAHATLPLHTLQRWAGRRWKKATLREIGFVYQMGHGGNACEVPAPEISSLMVMCDKSGNHFLNLRYCNCGKYGLDGATKPGQWLQIRRHGWFASTSKHPGAKYSRGLKHLHNVTHKKRRLRLNLRALDDSLAEWIPVDEQGCVLSADVDQISGASTDLLFARKRKSYTSSVGEMFPQDEPMSEFGEVEQMYLEETLRLHGLGFSTSAPCCALCEQGEWTDGYWCKTTLKTIGLVYQLGHEGFKSAAPQCLVSRDKDGSQHGGWGAFVEPRRYKKHLRKYVAEKDISTCIAFAALTQKETRNTAGLRVSGVGGCGLYSCVGSEGGGPDGIYGVDIACQWKKNFKARMEKLPKALQRDFNEVLMQSGLPVWHALAHEEDCTNENNLALLPGVGKSDGEDIERLWAHLNGFQTKEMSVGNRADTIEDRLDSHNFLKNLGQDAFKEINKTIHSGKRVEWQAQIDTYLKDCSVPNPYVIQKKAEIRVMLKKEEQAEAVAGDAPLHATSEMAFLTAGLQLENTQRRIKSGIAATTHLTTDCAIKVEEHRLAFFAKLRPFRTLQEVYMPGAAHMLARDAEAHADDAPAPAAERVRLWLPSGLLDGERASGCQRNLPEMEARLRESQCTDVLSAIRLALHSKRHLLTFRHDNIGGQIRQTRSHSIVDQLSIRIDALAAKYTEARAALSALKAEEYAPHLKKLVKADLRLEAEGKENDTEADRSDRAGARKLGKIGGRPLREVGKSSVLSWIWTARGVLDDNEEELHEPTDSLRDVALRIEWSRAKARKTRWEEEVQLLREEMWRVIRYLVWEVETWGERAVAADKRTDITEDARSGLRGYALA
ncbi:hypothetical protein C8F04DRAFT_1195583 [Mycena alexandri]|uniref:CxC2-like cysteine cluster KDZ transposase-associated domain-containing protein n=1 Tax=Mycena alexandri TaxID=1745969 RepID=A0AAD6WNP2_9AGAR|nr:hypothetical protein C8F04DRAFT_1195583 [Mycena alexandri]